MPLPPTERSAFLARLSASELALLRPHLSAFEMRIEDCLFHIGDQIDEVVFPRSGLVVLSIPAHDGGGAGIMIGREGMIGGYAAAAAAPATSDAEICIGGQALRMSLTGFRHVLDQCPSIRRLAAQFDVAI